MKRNNRLIGKLSRKKGEEFEKKFKSLAVKSNWEVLDIPNGCEWVGPKRVKPVPTPFDFVLVNDWPDCIFCDVKTTHKNTFPSSSIDTNQAESLEKIGNRYYASGYFINFSELNITAFFDHIKLIDCKNTPRSSLKPECGIICGTNDSIDFEHLMNIYADLRLGGVR